MSPFLVYFLMMADDIKGTAGWLAFLIGFGAVISIIAAIVLESCANDFKQRATAIADNRQDCYGRSKNELQSRADEYVANLSMAKRVRKWLVGSAVALICINTFMPGTRTIAAMVVLPKITSPQALDAMGNEAKELYGLAKDALRNLAGDDKKQPQH